MWWKDLLKAIVYGAGGLFCTVVVLLILYQEKLVYVPVIPGAGRKYPYTPARLRMVYEDVWLTAADGVKLHGWLIKHNPPIAGPTILFFQENAGNIAHRLESVRVMMYRLRCNIFLLSYRGYGASEGSPSQKGIMSDSQAALDYILQRTDINSKQIVAFGRSLGGAVAAQLVYRNPEKVACLVLENTFTSIMDMAGVLLPPLKYLVGPGVKPLNFFIRSQWRTIDIINKLPVPMLLISGKLDEMVPPAQMQALGRAVEGQNKCRFIEFENGHHMDTWMKGGERYWRAIELFMLQHLPASSGQQQ